MSNKSKNFKIITLGCKVNLFESEAIASALIKAGYKQTKSDKNIDIIIVNTCAVTSKAAMQSRQALRKAARLTGADKKRKLIAAGCYVQVGREEIKNIENIDAIIGHLNKHNIAEIILKDDYDKYISEKKNIFSEKNFSCFSTLPIGIRSRPFLKIEDGCSSFCSYCIVPYARGKSRSMPFDTVLDSLKKFGNAGYYEAVLTGINIGNYGADFVPSTNLFELLKKIKKTNPIGRIRLSSIEPLHLTQDIIKLAADSNILCGHFHMPLQSGDNKILDRMRRNYKAEDFENIVKQIVKLTPNAAIGADIIAGFPGETEEAFNNTYQLIKALPISYLHVFPFSARKGTLAASFAEQIPSDIIKKRASKLRELGKIKKNIFYSRMKNFVFETVVEKKDKQNPELLKGVTSNYIPVFFPCHKKNIKSGSMIKVKIIKAIKDNKVFGEAIV
jgi:threonylcarbamoyladenosine tRNA methylthiotransferase MtaB